MNRRFGSKRPAKGARENTVMHIALVKPEPFDDARKVSLSRQYGLTVSEIERIFADAARKRCVA